MMKTSSVLALFLAFGLTGCVIESTGSTGTTDGMASASSGEVSQKVINDCRARLRQDFPTQQMSVISARQGETSFIVDFEVEGAEEPWRCYHDGTRCTGAEYQGEG